MQSQASAESALLLASLGVSCLAAYEELEHEADVSLGGRLHKLWLVEINPAQSKPSTVSRCKPRCQQLEFVGVVAQQLIHVQDIAALLQIHLARCMLDRGMVEVKICKPENEMLSHAPHTGSELLHTHLHRGSDRAIWLPQCCSDTQ